MFKISHRNFAQSSPVSTVAWRANRELLRGQRRADWWPRIYGEIPFVAKQPTNTEAKTKITVMMMVIYDGDGDDDDDDDDDDDGDDDGDNDDDDDDDDQNIERRV